MSLSLMLTILNKPYLCGGCDYITATAVLVSYTKY